MNWIDWFRALVVILIIPVCLMVVVYYGFRTDYTVDVFSRESYIELNTQGIFKYRLLGTELIITTNDFLVSYQDKIPLPVKNYFMPSDEFFHDLDRNSQASFYFGYFLINTAFFVLTCLTIYLFFIINSRFDRYLIARDLTFISMVIALSQYAVTSYDMVSIFLLVLSILLYSLNNTRAFVACVLTTSLGMLTHETAALILPWVASKYVVTHGVTIHRSVWRFIVVGVVSVSTYLSLRFILGWERAIFQYVTLRENLINYGSKIGQLLFFGLLFVIWGDGKKRNAQSKYFLVFVLPYLFFILMYGKLFELRLFVPILVALILLQHDKSIPTIRTE